MRLNKVLYLKARLRKKQWFINMFRKWTWAFQGDLIFHSNLWECSFGHFLHSYTHSCCKGTRRYSRLQMRSRYIETIHQLANCIKLQCYNILQCCIWNDINQWNTLPVFFLFMTCSLIQSAAESWASRNLGPSAPALRPRCAAHFECQRRPKQGHRGGSLGRSRWGGVKWWGEVVRIER